MHEGWKKTQRHGHGQSRGITQKGTSREVRSGRDVKCLELEDERPGGGIWYFWASTVLESMTLIEYLSLEPQSTTGVTHWTLVVLLDSPSSICSSRGTLSHLTAVAWEGLFFFTSFDLFSFLLGPKLLFSCFDLNYVYVPLWLVPPPSCDCLRCSHIHFGCFTADA